MGVSVGAQTGVYRYAEASLGSSESNADNSTWQNTTLTGQNISLKAGVTLTCAAPSGA